VSTGCFVSGSVCCKECDRNRRDTNRLRAWLRYIERRIGLIGWEIGSTDVSEEIRNALLGAKPPKVSR
jgi:hypothetical protein